MYIAPYEFWKPQDAACLPNFSATIEADGEPHRRTWEIKCEWMFFRNEKTVSGKLQIHDPLLHKALSCLYAFEYCSLVPVGQKCVLFVQPDLHVNVLRTASRYKVPHERWTQNS